MTSYEQFIANGNPSSEWEAHRIEANKISRLGREKDFITKWKSGSKINGNDIVNYLRDKNIEIPLDIKRALQHDNTTVSLISVSGQGMARPEANKIHKFIVTKMEIKNEN